MAGLDARNKLTALERRLANQKETARKARDAARKVGSEAIERQAGNASEERRAIEHERSDIDLPQRKQPPQAQRERKRERSLSSDWRHFAGGPYMCHGLWPQTRLSIWVQP